MHCLFAFSPLIELVWHATPYSQQGKDRLEGTGALEEEEVVSDREARMSPMWNHKKSSSVANKPGNSCSPP